MIQKIKYEYKSILAAGAKKFYELGYTPISDLGDLSMRDPETGYLYFLPNKGPEMDMRSRGSSGDCHTVVM